MEKEILELINSCDSCTVKREIRELKKIYRKEHEERNGIIEANIKLVDKNRWLKEDILILCEFINTYCDDKQIDESIKRILNNYKEK